MADHVDIYRKLNINDVEDSAAACGLTIQEARFPREDLGAILPATSSGDTYETRQRLGRKVVDNLKAFLG